MNGGVVNIIIKGEQKVIEPGALSYEDVVELAGLRAYRNPSITWKRPDGIGGTLSHGQYVTPENGMVFNAAYTGGA
jgi:hypothetical protein